MIIIVSPQYSRRVAHAFTTRAVTDATPAAPSTTSSRGAPGTSATVGHASSVSVSATPPPARTTRRWPKNESPLILGESLHLKCIVS